MELLPGVLCVRCEVFSDVEPEALNLQAGIINPQKSIGPFNEDLLVQFSLYMQ